MERWEHACHAHQIVLFVDGRSEKMAAQAHCLRLQKLQGKEACLRVVTELDRFTC